MKKFLEDFFRIKNKISPVHRNDFHIVFDKQYGLYRIGTSGHDYYVVPVTHPYHEKATTSGGYRSNLAIYLEEDNQIQQL